MANTKKFLEAIMEKKSNIIMILAYVLLVFMFFGAGFFVGTLTNPKPVVSRTVSKNELMSVSMPATITEKLQYSVKLQGDELSLLRITQDGEEMIYSIKISQNMFPKDDIEQLKEGIECENIDEARALIENFSS